METHDQITLHPGEIFRQLGRSMNQLHNNLSITIPTHTSWRSAIRAVEESMGDIDELIVITPPGADSHSRRLRQYALRQVGELDSILETHASGLPIRTTVDLQSVGSPPRASENAQTRIREAARDLTEEQLRQPYATLRAGIVENCLALVTANVTIQGLDVLVTDPTCRFDVVNMIWDTGAHYTLISEDILPPEFREYLKDSVHDPYRSESGLRLQIEGNIVFTNCFIPIAAVALVVPTATIPNQRAGTLFGQTHCIDRLIHRSIPRCLLQAKGENVADNTWGDFIIEEYLDTDDRIVTL